jgi:anthranilate phosphoribosyltransferase
VQEHWNLTCVQWGSFSVLELAKQINSIFLFVIKEAIIQAAAKKNLSREVAETVMDEIMGGKATDIQIAAFLTAMSVKGETIEEITACAIGMRKHCIRVLHNMECLEIVGTGGDNSNTFNISTTAALVISSCGIPVAKHGNRAASSRSGSADVLGSLGIKLDITPEHSLKILQNINLCFLFAQNYHLSMKYVAPVRKELGIRTIFNILGPLANPAGASMQLLGVYDEELLEPMAQVLLNLGVRSGMVVFGQDGLDEISMSAPTSICEFRDGWLKKYVITPEQFGFNRCKKEELVGGAPEENAKITMDILSGARGPKFDTVLLNSAAAIHIAKPELAIEDAINIAVKSIDSGKAVEQLKDFIRLSNEN